jgi:hypothetical protein
MKKMQLEQQLEQQYIQLKIEYVNLKKKHDKLQNENKIIKDLLKKFMTPSTEEKEIEKNNIVLEHNLGNCVVYDISK